MKKFERFRYAIYYRSWSCDLHGNVYNKNKKIIGHKTKDGYMKTTLRIDNKPYEVKLHQFVYWFFKGDYNEKLVIDHINQNKMDNRLSNLRLVTNTQNQYNKEAKGYSRHKDKFRSTISFNRKTIHLGIFETETEARNAYLKAKEKYFKIETTI